MIIYALVLKYSQPGQQLTTTSEKVQLIITQAVNNQQHKESLMPHKLPILPWGKIGVNFKEKQYLMMVKNLLQLLHDTRSLFSTADA